MEKKLTELMAMVRRLKFYQAGPDDTYWIEFTDAYEKRVLCDESLDDLIARAHSIASISARSWRETA